MELLRKSKARADAKRYLKLFKKHIVTFDSNYSVKTTLTTITLQKKSFGSLEEKGIFDYKVGVIKKLYMVLLGLSNVDQFIDWLENNELSPFNDSEYESIATPPPDPFVTPHCKQNVDGKWECY